MVKASRRGPGRRLRQRANPPRAPLLTAGQARAPRPGAMRHAARAGAGHEPPPSRDNPKTRYFGCGDTFVARGPDDRLWQVRRRPGPKPKRFTRRWSIQLQKWIRNEADPAPARPDEGPEPVHRDEAVSALVDEPDNVIRVEEPDQ